ncbi:hypothetical protein G7070_12655 [Propioniciclava coleopterorum]|uniref:Cell division protein FtsL n=1 Tax=Propioniciclava coleopterorum TaxID=2714937 RepID=A0A6G7Y8K4_9ACTN|nr:hypothetical protein [Propioniciclava coleopterorum]QIK72961.1 hypothetical protein G7070_12655 [Propioniciclava coleopterorum]
MTAWEAIKQAPRKLGQAATRPNLVGISSPPQRMSALMFGVVMVAVLVAGLVGALVLSTALQTREFELRDAQRTAGELGYQVSDLESQVNRAKAPQQLGRRATELGMVPNPHAVFIDLGTGEIKGTPTAANGNEIPSLRILPPPPPSVAPTPGAEAQQEGTPTAEGQAGAEPDAATPADPTAPPTATPSTSATPSATATPSGAATPSPGTGGATPPPATGVRPTPTGAQG